MDTFQFNGFELDPNKRELRYAGETIALQPRIFQLLSYLIKHRDRMVSKDELLEAIWPGMIVTDSSLQRAVSLARAALRRGNAESAIRTYSRQGYGFDSSRTATDETDDQDYTKLLHLATMAKQDGDWYQALQLYQQANRRQALPGEELENWAQAAHCGGYLKEGLQPLEQAVATYSSGGHSQAAARVMISLTHICFELRDFAIAKGWLQRAEKLTADLAQCREQGLVAWLKSRISALEGDLEYAVEQAQQARALGQQLHDADLEVLGAAYCGLSLLGLGDIERGVALQDEAATSVVSGQVSPLYGGTVFCAVVWSCCNRCDWSRVRQWTDQFYRWCGDTSIVAFPGLYSLHNSELQCILGELPLAIKEVRAAIELLRENMPWAVGDAYRIEGDIHLARSELSEADVCYRRAYELGWDPQPGLALLRFYQGDSVSAISGLETALQSHGWSQRQRRALLLCRLAEIAALTGDVDRAVAAMDELESQQNLIVTNALRAHVAQSWAEIAAAESHIDEAIQSLRRAIDLWQQVGSAFQVANLRLRLARLMVDNNPRHDAELELTAAESAFTALEIPAMLEQCRIVRDLLQQI